MTLTLDRGRRGYHAAMYLDALEFLEEERDAWAPFEALADLPDDALLRPIEAAHGWSGRDLMAHMLAWQSVSLDVARELALGEVSPTIQRVDDDWDTRGGEIVNAEIQATWSALPLEELRDRFRSQPGELRGTLTVVPETRWIKHPTHMKSFNQETIDHYRDHAEDLEAILAAARG
jgi:Mycothiol maleylpyruvate isomerase N-terminal domain